MPPPVPPVPPSASHAPAPVGPAPPVVPSEGPAGAFLVDLCIYNGAPFADHWAYFIRPANSPSIGVTIQALGDVLHGFSFQIERNHDIEHAENRPTKRIPMQWVDGNHFDEAAMLGDGTARIDANPNCPFEVILHAVEVPGKSLNSIRSTVAKGKKIVQRNCQTWIVEAADELVKAGMFEATTAAYLRAVKQ